ncbi:MAG: helicase-related protein [Aggregatilineales bacterium]
MRIPYVIDNIEHQLGDVLNYLLQRQTGQDVDIATAYFSIRGFQLLRHALPSVRCLRLLLGDDPQDADGVGVRPDAKAYLRNELNAEPLREETQILVEELVRFLRRDDVHVRLYRGREAEEKGRRRFLHAKCYLFYGSLDGQSAIFDRFTPLVGIVGSSNFTGPGLTTNRELSLVHKTLLDAEDIDDPEARAEVSHHSQSRLNETITLGNQRLLKSEVGARAIIDLTRWYNAQWDQADDYKAALVDLLENSKFGGREYTPYQIYMKALYEYFKDDLDTDLDTPITRSAVDLAEFQEDAVKKARRILARYDGVIIGDSVGLGKTWIGKKLLEDRAYHMRQKALVVCPASLKKMWESELGSAAIAATVMTQEQLGQKDFDVSPYADMDVIVVDEAHNFRNHRAQRYQNLEFIVAANNRRGRGGERKKVILLTATPINNNIFDLYNQINLFTSGDRTYFAVAGIGDLYRYFLSARQKSVEQGSVKIFNLLEEVVIRRTRQFIKRAYPEATIRGKKITWPERRLQTIEYDLEATYEGFYAEIVRRIDGLSLPHYNLESYKKKNEPQDDFELGRQIALVGIFKSRFLKRLESSIDSFRISIGRALEFAKTFAEYVQDDIVLDAASFQTAMRLLENDDEDNDDTLPTSRAEEIDQSAAAREVIDTLPRLDSTKYDRRRLHRDLTADIDALTQIWDEIRRIKVDQDAKLQRLKTLLATDLHGQKVLIFTYYKDTAHYLYRSLSSDEAWLQQMGQPNIRRVDSSVKALDRVRLIEAFAPAASGHPNLVGTSQEVNILIATDVMSEGQNLQDCGCLINYDLHWNPTRMVQRAGRIDRLGSQFEVLTIYNLFPETELEQLLGLVRRLTSKIDTINQTGFLDASILGEVVTPRDFNTLRRIAEEDNTVIEEQEAFLELASSEALLAQLQKLLATEARQWLTDLDDGIHSGIQRPGMRGVFMYFTALHSQGEGRQHFWRYYDLDRREITDNRYQIMQIIAAGPETPRFPPPYTEVNIFDVQEKVVENILQSVSSQQAAAAAPKVVSEEQLTVAELLREHIDRPETTRDEIREMRKFLKQPLPGAYVKRLRSSLQTFTTSKNILDLLGVVRELQQAFGTVETDVKPQYAIKVEGLHLVCYEYVC